jgi:hypothetical protein
MANNRMYLSCKGERILLAKYYPSMGGWGIYHPLRKLNKFLTENSELSQFGNTDFGLEFETDEMSENIEQETKPNDTLEERNI